MTAREFIAYPMRLEPVYSPRPWGGDRLRSALGKPVDDSRGPVGESWELSDHPDGRSRVAEGPHAGELFGDLAREFPRGMLGRDTPPDRYPLLVKYIDAGQDLSIQVHPDDERAAPRGDRGKCECWYVMDCRPGAEIIYGLHDHVTPEDLRSAAEAGHVEKLVRRHPVRPGAFVFMPPGVVHAMLGGTLVCEIQQASNLTYRLWDWNRHPKRPLHIEDSVAVSRYGPDHTHPIEHTHDLEHGERPLVKSPYFHVELKAIGEPGETPWRIENRNGVIVNVVGGSGEWRANGLKHKTSEIPDSAKLRLGDTWYLPPGVDDFKIATEKPGLRLLVSRSTEL